jgi:hypothetical protein
LDAASLDRFVFLDWGYDEKLEQKLAGNRKWSEYVRLVRIVITDNKIRHVVSPRASIFGAKLLAKGMKREEVEELVLWKGLSRQTVDKIKEELKPSKGLTAPKDGYFEASVERRQSIEKGLRIGTLSENNYTSGDEIMANATGVIIILAENGYMSKGDIIAEIRIS